MTNSKPSRPRVRAAKRPSQAAKVGLAPGALIHLGERKTEQAAISLLEYGEAELIERITKAKGPLPQFTSCCPAWVRYCETFHPEMIPHISSAKSPASIRFASSTSCSALSRGTFPICFR